MFVVLDSLDLVSIKARVTTPAFIVNVAYIARILENLKHLRQQDACSVLFSIKSLPLEPVIKHIVPHVDGLSVSSLFEARLADELCSAKMNLHLTTPGLRTKEVAILGQLCQHISFNSLGQLQRFSRLLPASCSLGLRLNPNLSFSIDKRYDPCRQHSKLGVSLQDAKQNWAKNIKGIHFHTVFNQQNFAPLLATIALIESKLGKNLYDLDWINLGGGYLFDDNIDMRPLIKVARHLKLQYGVSVFIEPGNALVGRAGYLIASVIDLLRQDGKNIAILDTSINHNPEVFEYQKKPVLYKQIKTGKYPFILAGSTCLAGDLFGEYRFEQPLKLDDRIVFSGVGAYSLAKANRFNGYNLPDIYCANATTLNLVKQYSYQHYQQQWLSD